MPRLINLQLVAMMRVAHEARASAEADEVTAPVTGGEVHPDPVGEEWLLLDRCPFCGHREAAFRRGHR